MGERKRVLWISDSAKCFWVGQSIVTREICKRLTNRYDIVQGGYLEDAVKDKLPQVEFPVVAIPRGDTEKTIEVINQQKPDVVLWSHDAHLIGNIVDIRNKVDEKIKFIGYMTIDGYPINPVFRSLFKRFDRIIIPSQFGADVLKNQWFDLEADAVVPYGIDHELFKPPTADKLAVKTQIEHATRNTKQRMPFAGKFLCSFAGHNQSKKNIGAIVDAWHMFEKDKDDVLLVLMTHSAAIGKNVVAYDDSLFYDLKKFVLIKSILSPNDIRDIIGCSDILAFPSCGEGFGLPPLEAMACGTVPIVPAFAALKDYCNTQNSYLIDYTLIRGELCTIRAVASYDSMHQCYEQAYKDWKSGDIKIKAQAGIETAKNYSWDKCADAIAEQIEQTLAMDRMQKTMTAVRVI